MPWLFLPLYGILSKCECRTKNLNPPKIFIEKNNIMKYSRKEFRKYKNNLIRIYKEISQTSSKNQYDEQALPSYINPNPLMQFLFWERIFSVINYLSKIEKFYICLDFGCGMGPMIPYLIENTELLFALDLDTSLLKEIGEKEDWKGVKYIKNLNEINKYAEKIGLILALDVLEHVDDLVLVLLDFHRLLSKDGFLVISGPTENFIYKIGRKLANYSGDYHVRNIYDVKHESKKYFQLVTQRTLFKPLPFFEIYWIKRNF